MVAGPDFGPVPESKRPGHGSLTLNGNGSFSYTPAANYDGTDSFSYRASDGTLESNQATVTITITATNDGPTAADDAYSTAEDTVLTLAAPGVLSNDSDPDGDPLTAALVTGPSHGTLTLNGNGSFSYSPAGNFNGGDSFTYRASDGSLDSNPATVAISVTATNDAPVTVAAGGTCGTDDHSGTIYLALGDAETAATVVTLSAASSNPSLAPNGNIVFAGSGETRMLTVSAVDGRSGTAIVTATVSDGQDSGLIAVTVRVGGSGKDTITGGSAGDLIFAQSNNDTITGGDGNDLLCGDSGGDTLAGGGSDRLTGGSGADRFGGGAGVDAATDFMPAEGDTTDGTVP